MKQLKPNFTQIPNVYLDEYMRELDSDTFKVLMVLSRKIYGYHKDSDRISQSQIIELSGLTKKMVKKALRILIERNLINVVESETRFKGRRYELILCEDREEVKNSPSKELSKTLRGFQDDPSEGPTETLRGSLRDPKEGPPGTPQNKIEIKQLNISVNKEESIKTEIVKIDRHTEYLVNNLPRSEIRQDSITNRINEFMMKLWKQYYQLPYKADLFETDRLAHELDHDWNSFLTLVKAFQTDQYWAKVSMSPRMLRKAWDTLGSRAKVSENAEREKYTNYREHYEQQLMEHEANKKQLKQTADNWKPWNIKEELSKMENKK